MGQKEREIMVPRLLNLEPHEKLFRINAGMGWVGQVVRHDNNVIILKNPRPLRAAPGGWPDLCGWTTVTITHDMVGKKIAVFTMEEIKSKNDRMRKEQKKFKRVLEKMGGIYRILTDAPKNDF